MSNDFCLYNKWLKYTLYVANEILFCCPIQNRIKFLTQTINEMIQGNQIAVSEYIFCLIACVPNGLKSEEVKQ